MIYTYDMLPMCQYVVFSHLWVYHNCPVSYDVCPNLRTIRPLCTLSLSLHSHTTEQNIIDTLESNTTQRLNVFGIPKLWLTLFGIPKLWLTLFGIPKLWLQLV